MKFNDFDEKAAIWLCILIYIYIYEYNTDFRLMILMPYDGYIYIHIFIQWYCFDDIYGTMIMDMYWWCHEVAYGYCIHDIYHDDMTWENDFTVMVT